MRQRLGVFLVAAVAVVLSSAGCSSDKPTEGGAGAGGQEIRIELTPTVAAGAASSQSVTWTITYLIHCLDQSTPSCPSLVYN